MKVTTIEESKNVDTITIDELIRSIQTYELTLQPSKKNKGVALKRMNTLFHILVGSRNTLRQRMNKITHQTRDIIISSDGKNSILLVLDVLPIVVLAIYLHSVKQIKKKSRIPLNTTFSDTKNEQEKENNSEDYGTNNCAIMAKATMHSTYFNKSSYENDKGVKYSFLLGKYNAYNYKELFEDCKVLRKKETNF